jgi:hypothetical protein
MDDSLNADSKDITKHEIEEFEFNSCIDKSIV